MANATIIIQIRIAFNYSYLYLNHDRKEFIKSGNDLLISTSSFNLTPKNTAQRHWRSFKKKMGYNKDIRIHDFRRYFSTILMKNDVPDEVAKELMGHSSIDMTQYYQNIDLDTKIEYMKNINI